jgi:hypothetical protein
MVLTLVAFAWFFWKTHQRTERALIITPVVLFDGGVP